MVDKISAYSRGFQPCVTRAGVLYFHHFLEAPRWARQLKQEEEPLQLKAFATTKRAVGSPYRGVRSPYGASVPLTGESVPLTGLF